MSRSGRSLCIADCRDPSNVTARRTGSGAARRQRVRDAGDSRVEGHPWVPVGHLWVPDFSVDIRGSPHKNRQPWVPATSFLFCVRWATRPNCQPLRECCLLVLNLVSSTLLDTVTYRVRRRPDRFHARRRAPPLHSPCQKFGNTDYFFKLPAKSTMRGSMKLWEAAQ